MDHVKTKRGRWKHVLGWLLIATGVIRVGLPALYAAAVMGRPMAMAPEVVMPSLVLIAAGAMFIVWGRRTRGTTK